MAICSGIRFLYRLYWKFLFR